jgi:hypothetical protein
LLERCAKWTPTTPFKVDDPPLFETYLEAVPSPCTELRDWRPERSADCVALGPLGGGGGGISGLGMAVGGGGGTAEDFRSI